MHSEIRIATKAQERGVHAASMVIAKKSVHFNSALLKHATVKRRERRAPAFRHVFGLGRPNFHLAFRTCFELRVSNFDP
jgi:hypothetical protein